jgi:hypothetical protein
VPNKQVRCCCACPYAGAALARHGNVIALTGTGLPIGFRTGSVAAQLSVGARGHVWPSHKALLCIDDAAASV